MNTPPQQRRNRSRTLLEEIDLTMYKDKTKEKKPDLSDCCYNQDRTHEIGKIKCSLQFLKNKILVEILSVDVKHHPSSFVNGSTWIIKPLMKIEVKKNNQSPTVKRKQSVFQSITQKTEVVWTTGHCCELPFKNKQPSDYNLRLTLYDADRHNTELVIGYFHVPIENIAQAENALFVEDDIVPNSQVNYAVCSYKETKYISISFNKSLKRNTACNNLITKFGTAPLSKKILSPFYTITFCTIIFFLNLVSGTE